MKYYEFCIAVLIVIMGIYDITITNRISYQKQINHELSDKVKELQEQCSNKSEMSPLYGIEQYASKNSFNSKNG